MVGAQFRTIQAWSDTKQVWSDNKQYGRKLSFAPSKHGRNQARMVVFTATVIIAPRARRELNDRDNSCPMT